MISLRTHVLPVRASLHAHVILILQLHADSAMSMCMLLPIVFVFNGFPSLVRERVRTSANTARSCAPRA